MGHREDWSYRHHEEQEHSSAETKELPLCYTNPESIDAWRHRRMHLTLMPLLEQNREATWMTVGDGRYGSDAHFLQQQGVEVVASSLTDSTLKVAESEGFIGKSRAENAEALTVDDGSFDFVLCKEAYHHFPRPPVAFYEMLRVARIAVVLIEPIEQDRPLNRLKDRIKVCIRKDTSTIYEPGGNFLFRVSLSEIEKMMMALDYRMLAHRKFNDFFHPHLGDGIASRLSGAALATRAGISVQDVFCRSGLLQWGLATIIIFKALPGGATLRACEEAGYQIMKFPRNPSR